MRKIATGPSSPGHYILWNTKEVSDLFITPAMVDIVVLDSTDKCTQLTFDDLCGDLAGDCAKPVTHTSGCRRDLDALFGLFYLQSLPGLNLKLVWSILLKDYEHPCFWRHDELKLVQPFVSPLVLWRRNYLERIVGYRMVCRFFGAFSAPAASTCFQVSTSPTMRRYPMCNGSSFC